MGFPDVTSTLDTASQMLAGGSSTPTAASPSSQAVFARGVHLDEEDPNYSGATSPNLLNEKDASVLLEFIHFGNVHTTYANYFVHSTSFKDNEKDDKFAPNLRPRAIQFRSALEREAVLLSVFMECTQTVLQERQDSKGALGTAMNTLGSMVGAGGGGSGQTTPGEVNPHIQKVVGAIKPVLGESITYPPVHQAGRDMHQARADYRALLSKIDKEKPSSDAGSSLTNKLMTGISSGLGGAGGTIGDVISFAQGLAFKPQDVKVKFYIKVAIQQEPQIETACHDMTLKAIQAAQNPVLPVWFGDPNAQGTPPEAWDGSQAPQNPLQHEDDRSNLLRKPINMVADPMQQFRNDRVQDANKIKNFFENPTPPEPPPGTDALAEAFEVAAKPKGKQDPMPMQMGALAVQAFIEALGLTSPINSFCEGIISTVVAVTLDFMHGTYEALLVRSPDDAITDGALYQAAQDQLQITQRLLALASEKVKFIQDARDFKTPEKYGYSVGVGQMIDKQAGNVEAPDPGQDRPDCGEGAGARDGGFGQAARPRPHGRQREPVPDDGMVSRTAALGDFDPVLGPLLPVLERADESRDRCGGPADCLGSQADYRRGRFGGQHAEHRPRRHRQGAGGQQGFLGWPEHGRSLEAASGHCPGHHGVAARGADRPGPGRVHRAGKRPVDHR